MRGEDAARPNAESPLDPLGPIEPLATSARRCMSMCLCHLPAAAGRLQRGGDLRRLRTSVPRELLSLRSSPSLMTEENDGGVYSRFVLG
jgi:hypothetical protein